MLGYFGPAGTFTHQAILTLRDDPRWGAFVDDARPYGSVPAALAAVRDGEAEAVMVPIENSVEGGVTATLDNLGDPDAAPLQIMAETLVDVTFDLAVRPGTALADIRQVITHPHAAAQTRAWLEATLPQAAVIERGSTAGAAEAVADPESGFDAAICAPVATALYGLTAAAHDIGDTEAAVTRFVLVARRGPSPAPTGHDKTTFVAYMPEDGRPTPPEDGRPTPPEDGAGPVTTANHSGALLEILQQLAVRGVNLCRIESRPTKTTLGSYCFSIDAEGHIADARLAEALMGLKRHSHNVVFLGSYARADGQVTRVPPDATDEAYQSADAWLDGISHPLS